MADAQKYKVLRRMSPGKITSPGVYGCSDDTGQIDRQHYNYFTGRTQTQSGQILIHPMSTLFPVNIMRGLIGSRIQSGPSVLMWLDRKGEVLATPPQTSCKISTRYWRGRSTTISVCSLEKLTLVSLTFLLTRLYSETKSQYRFVFQ